MTCLGPQAPPSPKAQPVESQKEQGRQRPHLVGLDQVKVLPVHSEAMLKVPALLLTPSTEPICKQEGGHNGISSAQEVTRAENGRARAIRSPRITFTLNRSLRRASSALKLHFTSS